MKFFSLIKKGEIRSEKETKVIPKDTFSELIEAKELTEQALQDVEQYKKENEETCKKLREAAEKEGFEKGLAQLNEHIVHLDLLIKNLRSEMQRQVLPVALNAAKKIVAKELESKPETIVDIVMQALLPVTQNHRVKIYINKADREFLENEKPRIKEMFEHLEVLLIQERPDIEQGGCIIETETGIINAELENQWRSLEAAFEKFLKQQST